jgi:heat shock protein HslJ
MAMRKLALISLVAVVTAACLGSDFADSVEGSWEMTSGRVDGEEIPLLDSHPITITFEGSEVSGTAACNGYGGTFELDGSEITVGALAMTEMACIPEETMQAEAMFGTALPRVQTVAIDDQMTLSGEGVELVFESVSDAG